MLTQSNTFTTLGEPSATGAVDNNSSNRSNAGAVAGGQSRLLFFVLRSIGLKFGDNRPGRWSRRSHNHRNLHIPRRSTWSKEP